MNNHSEVTKKLFYVIAVLLSLLIIVAIAFFEFTDGSIFEEVEPANPVIDETEDGKITIDDLYAGEMNIPKYDIPTNEYKLDAFSDQNGVIIYDDAPFYVGIDVSEFQGAIDWQTVKNSGVDFAIIRSGYRGNTRGELYEDPTFKANIEGAQAVGIKVGVYFFSQAMSIDEAEEEAEFVLEQLKDYQLDYPVVYDWEPPESGSTDARTANANGIDVSKYAKTFCDKVSLAGYEAMLYTNKSLGYTFFDLELLKDYDIWIAEYQMKPSFYYDFTIWQYTDNAVVEGIEGPVDLNISFKDY